MCFLSPFASLYGTVQAGDTVHIPGGGGGVGHLAVHMARGSLGASLVISSGSMLQSTALARQSGAHYVSDYKRDDIAAEISKLTGARGADPVFDATYSNAISASSRNEWTMEQTHIQNSHMDDQPKNLTRLNQG
jgi:NADPH:quinone reductase-like Zn-dependent oxidoreductase